MMALSGRNPGIKHCLIQVIVNSYFSVARRSWICASICVYFSNLSFFCLHLYQQVLYRQTSDWKASPVLSLISLCSSYLLSFVRRSISLCRCPQDPQTACREPPDGSVQIQHLQRYLSYQTELQLAGITKCCKESLGILENISDFFRFRYNKYFWLFCLAEHSCLYGYF